jgi:hypothetical protein
MTDMTNLPVCVHCFSSHPLASHSVAGEQTRMKTMTTVIPPLPPLPYHLPHPHLHSLLPLPNAVNPLAFPASFAPLALRIATLLWKSKPLLRGKGNRRPNGFPPVQMMRSLRNPRSDGRRLAWRVTSAGSARSLAVNRQKAAWTGPASEFFLFLSTPVIPPLFGFGNLTGFPSFLVNASPEEWNASIPQNHVVGPVAARLPLTNIPTERTSSPPQCQKCAQCASRRPAYLFYFRRSLSLPILFSPSICFRSRLVIHKISVCFFAV